MGKSCAGLRVEEFLYLLNPMYPMQRFTADLGNMDRHGHFGFKLRAQIVDTTYRLNSGVAKSNGVN